MAEGEEHRGDVRLTLAGIPFAHPGSITAGGSVNHELAGMWHTIGMLQDSVQVQCKRCKSVFPERAKRLQNGYSRQCPSCEVVLFFDEDSQDPNIKRAMRRARRLRKELREMEGTGYPSRGSSRSFQGRGRSTEESD